MGKAKTSGDTLATAERRAFVFTLRKTGATYRKIAAAAVTRFGAEALPDGWGERFAHKDVNREYERLRDEIAEGADLTLRMELERLDRLMEALWSRATDGDDVAIDKVLKIMDRRAKYLGLNRPEGLELSGPNGSAVQMEDRVVIYVPDNGRGPRPGGAPGWPPAKVDDGGKGAKPDPK